MLWLFFLAGGTWLNPIFMLIASLIPDADHRYAPAGRILPLWLIFKHRGATHTLWAMMVSTLLVYILFSLASSLSWLVGYFSHIMLDAATPMGINWWGKRKKHSR